MATIPLGCLTISKFAHSNYKIKMTTLMCICQLIYRSITFYFSTSLMQLNMLQNAYHMFAIRNRTTLKDESNQLHSKMRAIRAIVLKRIIKRLYIRCDYRIVR